jgi:phenylalanyl-tRNA synthetase beta chain
MKELHTSLIFALRLAFIGELKEASPHNTLQYITHTTGVILRAYDISDINFEDNEKITLKASNKQDVIHISINDELCSKLGINQNEHRRASQDSNIVLFETS